MNALFKSVAIALLLFAVLTGIKIAFRPARGLSAEARSLKVQGFNTTVQLPKEDRCRQ